MRRKWPSPDAEKGLYLSLESNSLGKIYGLQMVYKLPKNGSITGFFQPLLRE